MRYHEVREKNEVINDGTWYFRWHLVLRKLDNLLGLMKSLGPEEQIIFNVDPHQLDSVKAAQAMHYGIERFFLKLDI